jgi:uncharacterized protein
MKVLVDTNCLLVAIPQKSTYRWLYDNLKAGELTLAVSTEILAEYEEQIADFYSPTVAENVLKTIINLPNIEKVEPSYRWDLITVDKDDNKFVDCAIACGADYIITNDKHFRVLENVPFPKVVCVDLATFKDILDKEQS